MNLKLTPQGALIYAAMAGYLAALLWLTFRREKRVGGILYFGGFVFAALAFVYRAYHTGHVPLQNMFEVFLCLGMISWPLSVFCRGALGVGSQRVDILIGLVMLFPAGFVFSAEPQKLPPALQSWLFAPHVAAYMLAYIILFKAAFQALQDLWGGGVGGSAEDPVYRMVLLGFPLLTIGLLLGSWWGKLAWGDYWNWDPKELWSLATWLVYVAYFHVHGMPGRDYKGLNSALTIAGAVCIVLTLVWVNLADAIFSGLHVYAG